MSGKFMKIDRFSYLVVLSEGGNSCPIVLLGIQDKGGFPGMGFFPSLQHSKWLSIMETIRQKQVAEMIRRNFGLVLQQDGGYAYEDAFVTVTQVKMSPDLGLAKIYLSVYNTDNKQAAILHLEEHNHILRQHLAHRIRKHIRRIPEIQLYLDDTLDEMDRLNKLFNQLHQEKQMGDPEEE